MPLTKFSGESIVLMPSYFGSGTAFNIIEIDGSSQMRHPPLIRERARGKITRALRRAQKTKQIVFSAKQTRDLNEADGPYGAPFTAPVTYACVWTGLGVRVALEIF